MPRVSIIGRLSTECTALQLVLDQAGHRVTIHSEFPESVGPCDLLLIDAWLPGRDPFIQINSLPKKMRTRVAIYAGCTTPTLVALCHRVGAVYFLDLSQDPQRVNKELSQVLAGEPALPPPPVSSPDLLRLSPREREVLRLLAQDISVKEAAELLGVAATTVETHRQSIRAKLDTRGSAALARIAIRDGLIAT